eukprot:5137799-Prymnesium_polylepis.2
MLSLVALPSAWHTAVPPAGSLRAAARAAVSMDAALIIQNKGGGHGESAARPAAAAEKMHTRAATRVTQPPTPTSPLWCAPSDPQSATTSRSSSPRTRAWTSRSSTRGPTRASRRTTRTATSTRRASRCSGATRSMTRRRASRSSATPSSALSS